MEKKKRNFLQYIYNFMIVCKPAMSFKAHGQPIYINYNRCDNKSMKIFKSKSSCMEFISSLKG